MIGQVLPRGTSVRGLLYYLFTEGLAGEKGLESAHSDARVIAGWDDTAGLAGLQPPVCDGGRRDFRALVSRLTEPVLALGLEPDQLKKYKPVYHLTVAAAKDPATGQLLDRRLPDEQWADIAREYLDRMGLAPRGDDTGVRWVAVRHADDHIHIVATLARQDGRRPRLFNDRYRSMEASRFLEVKYGLTATAATGRTGAPATSRAENRKHQATARRRQAEGRPGPAAPDRELLRRQVRTAAAGASNLTEFLARLRSDGLLVRERMSERNPGEVTGYAVALPDRYDTGGRPIFFGGGKLAPDLTLPQLQRRWQYTGPAGAQDAAGHRAATGAGRSPAGAGGHEGVGADRFGLTAAERLRIWQQATIAAAQAAEHITASALTDPEAAADAAWAASDFLAAAGRVAEGRGGGPLTEAAGVYDGAGRELFGKSPVPSPAGRGLRDAGRLLLMAQVAKPSELKQLLALMAQLTALADAVARLRDTQHRAVQARAARRAAEQLRAATGHYGLRNGRATDVASTVQGRRHPAAASPVTAPVTAPVTGPVTTSAGSPVDRPAVAPSRGPHR
jgi:hypothetical protein